MDNFLHSFLKIRRKGNNCLQKDPDFKFLKIEEKIEGKKDDFQRPQAKISTVNTA